MATKLDQCWSWGHDPATTCALAMALMLGWVQLGVMVWLTVGWLSAWAMTGWLALGTGLGLGLGKRPSFSWPPPAVTVITAGLFVPTLLMATVPPWMPDEMTYHLSLAREFAQAGAWVRPDDNIFASFPLGWQAIQAGLHTYGAGPDHYPPFGGRMISVWATLGTALATVGLARSLSIKAAHWCAPLFLLIPTVFEYGSSAYVESWLMLLLTLSLGAILRGVQASSGTHIWLAAVTAGFALSIKYPAVGYCAFVVLLLLFDVLRRDDEGGKLRLKRLVVFIAVASLVGAPFYLRNLVERGNPIFPTGFDLLGGTGWDEWRAWAYGVIQKNYGMGRTPIDHLWLPVRMFTTTDIQQGFEGALCPVLGLGAVVGAGLGLRRRATLFLTLFVVMWTVFWWATTQQLRFYMPAIPPLVVLCVMAMTHPWVRWGVVILHAAWCFPVNQTLYERQHTDKWVSGQATKDQVLGAMLPENYPYLGDVEKIIPEGDRVWLVWMRGYTYYWRRPYRLDCVFESWRFDKLIDEAETLEDIPEQLLSQGIRWALVNDRFMITKNGKEMTPGRTEHILGRYRALQDQGMFKVRLRWRQVVLYEIVQP